MNMLSICANIFVKKNYSNIRGYKNLVIYKESIRGRLELESDLFL